LKIPGISYDGGYEQYMLAPVEALVTIPDSLTEAEAAPLLCAGITTYNALRHSGAARLVCPLPLHMHHLAAEDLRRCIGTEMPHRSYSLPSGPSSARRMVPFSTSTLPALSV
jgi:hypothetical protein